MTPEVAREKAKEIIQKNGPYMTLWSKQALETEITSALLEASALKVGQNACDGKKENHRFKFTSTFDLESIQCGCGQYLQTELQNEVNKYKAMLFDASTEKPGMTREAVLQIVRQVCDWDCGNTTKPCDECNKAVDAILAICSAPIPTEVEKITIGPACNCNEPFNHPLENPCLVHGVEGVKGNEEISKNCLVVYLDLGQHDNLVNIWRIETIAKIKESLDQKDTFYRGEIEVLKAEIESLKETNKLLAQQGDKDFHEAARLREEIKRLNG